eukprot:m.15256 g.15256  ORF g.15256 m.15256 type:complete len:423 (-) comp4984_c0_seq2:103-1371(-)
MSTNFVDKAIQIVRQATEEDSKGNYEVAVRLYSNAIDHFVMAIKYEKSETIRQTLRMKTGEYLARAEKLKEFLAEKNKAGPQKAVAASGGKGDDDDAEKRALRAALKDAIVMEKPTVTFNDVAGLDNAKNALIEAVILPQTLPHLFQGKRKPWSAILLYGPPGTGKSYLAKAVAREAAGSTFISVSSSDLVSKWQGQSERLVKELFSIARENSPCIVFIDEVDALCGARGDSDTDSTRRIKSELLIQMQGVGHENRGILVLAATNIPWSLDPAFRRRFERRIYIGLPNNLARKIMFKLHMGKTHSTLQKEDYQKLADMSEGFSGSDIKAICKDAIMEPVRKIATATHFKRALIDGEQKYVPCSPGDKDAMATSWKTLDPSDIAASPVSMMDLYRATSEAKPTVNADDLGQLERWTSDFGMQG